MVGPAKKLPVSMHMMGIGATMLQFAAGQVSADCGEEVVHCVMQHHPSELSSQKLQGDFSFLRGG